jgi:hypothetical protein
MSRRLVLLSACFFLVSATSCGGGGGSTTVREGSTLIERVAQRFGLLDSVADDWVRRVASETQTSAESAARQLLESADETVGTGAARGRLALLIENALEVAEETFDRAVRATYCEAMVTYRTTGTVDARDLYSSAAENWSAEIADRLWNTGPIAEALNIVNDIANGNYDQVMLTAMQIAYCSKE